MGEAFPVSERAKGWNYDEKPWGKRRKELQEITTPQEFTRIEGSRLNAFYTTPPVIDAMWKTLDNMGVGKLDNPRVMEPGAGSGRFLGYEPKDITNKSERVAVELDPVTGRILKELYPKTETYVMGFEQAPIPKDSIDVAISNVPFGNYQVFDPSFKKTKRSLPMPFIIITLSKQWKSYGLAVYWLSLLHMRPWMRRVPNQSGNT